MTRINLVPPEELYDQHLVAEYREIFMVPASLERSLASPNWDPAKIPDEFTLNRGHVSFFYDKGWYLCQRYQALIREMVRRGMSPDPERRFPVEVFPKHMFKDWVPRPRDLEIIRHRIASRVAEKPRWYRKTPVK